LLRVRDDRSGAELVWSLSNWTGIVFLYSSDCRYCDENTANWLDLAAFIQPRGVRVAAVAVKDSLHHASYWAPVGPWLTRYTVLDNDSLIQQLGQPVVPTTYVLRNGVVERRFLGTLSVPSAKWIVRRFLNRGAETEFVQEVGL
jgi:hypothetical protein